MLNSKGIQSLQQSLRVSPLIFLLILLVLSPVESRYTRRPRRTTTPRSSTTSTSTTKRSDRHHHVHHWPPLVAPPQQPQVEVPQVVEPQPVVAAAQPRLIDSFDQRSADGQYEFRFQLDNGNTRYERAYWLPVGKDLVLAKKGYYSVPLPNEQYSTIFYTADHRGYHVDRHTLSGEQPLLPRNLEVPEVPREMGTGTKRNSISDPERNELDMKVDVDKDEDEDEDEDMDVAVEVDASGAATELAPNAVNQVETETEPSTVANDILATDSHVDHDDDEDDDDDDDDAGAGTGAGDENDDGRDDDGGASN
ncbi:hypothetical protein KR009_011055 [Drosophila setifemur]|nr:hypothetical protein KR009_011055 [Drosophila setifemur]